MKIKFDNRPGNNEIKFRFYPNGKFYIFPHYMPCMSWSPDRGQYVFKWLWFVYAVERKEVNYKYIIIKNEIKKYTKHPTQFFKLIYHRIFGYEYKVSFYRHDTQDFISSIFIKAKSEYLADEKATAWWWGKDNTFYDVYDISVINKIEIVKKEKK